MATSMDLFKERVEKAAQRWVKDRYPTVDAVRTAVDKACADMVKKAVMTALGMEYDSHGYTYRVRANSEFPLYRRIQRAAEKLAEEFVLPSLELTPKEKAAVERAYRKAYLVRLLELAETAGEEDAEEEANAILGTKEEES